MAAKRCVYVLACQANDFNVIGVVSNLKELHQALVNLQGDEAPSYQQVAKDFKQRSEYVQLTAYYDHEDEYRRIDVTFNEIGHVK